MGHVFRKIARRLKGFRQGIYKRTRIKILGMECRGLHPIGEFDIPIAIQDQFTPNEPEMKRRRDRGDRCYRVLDGKQSVHYSWMTQLPITLTEVGCFVHGSHTNPWIYDAYTMSTHRGRSLFPQVLLKIVDDVRAEGGEYVWVGVEDSNLASLHGILKAGFTDVGVLERTVWFSRLRSNRRRIVYDTPFREPFEALPYKWTP